MPIIRLQGEQERRENIYYEVDTDSTPLGVGGMGQVFAGTRVDQNTGTRLPVAIKFLFDDLSQGVIERARREAAIQINSENLVKMYGFIETAAPNGEKHYHVVSELLQGVMLADLLNGRTTDVNGNTVPFAQELYTRMQCDRQGFAAIIVKAVLSGLMAMHDKHYIHRDIDPSNIMITVQGNVKLIDYGIAKQIMSINTQDRALTSTGQFMGKAAYAAPELVTGDVPHQNETTDIYAVGIMLFQLLTSRLPFEGADHEVLEMQLKKKIPSTLISDREMRKVVEKATAKRQQDRYMSAAEFRVDLERNERHMKTNPGTPVLQHFKSGRFKTAALVGGIAVLVIAAVVSAVIMFSGDKGAEEETLVATPEAVIDDNVKPASSDPFAEARQKLNDASTVAEGMSELEAIADGGGSDAVKAALLLRKIYWHEYEATYDLVPEDIPKSLKMARRALDLDPDNPEALYWMGEAYLGGPDVAGDVVERRDPEKAKNLYLKALENGKKDGDELLVKRIKRGLEKVGVNADETASSESVTP